MVAAFTKAPTPQNRKKREKDVFATTVVLIEFCFFLFIWKWQFLKRYNKALTSNKSWYIEFQLIVKCHMSLLCFWDHKHFSYFSNFHVQILLFLPNVYLKIILGRLKALMDVCMKQHSRSTTLWMFHCLANVLCIIKLKQCFTNYSFLSC